MEKVPYANDVGCLMYAMVCTRLDIAQAISVVSRYMANPGKQHWDAVQWILRYLKGSWRQRIMFEKQKENEGVLGYVDADYARDLDKRRSTSGLCVYMRRMTNQLEGTTATNYIFVDHRGRVYCIGRSWKGNNLA